MDNILNNSLREIMEVYHHENKARYGVFSLNHVLFHSPMAFLEKIYQTYVIPSVLNDASSREDHVEEILRFFSRNFTQDKTLQQKFRDSTCYLGKSLFSLVKSSDLFLDYDFFAKTDLINVFADYAADLGINTYDSRRIDSYEFDLYLIKKTKGVFVTTESVIVRTLYDVQHESYEDLIAKIARSTMVAEWKLFVTTPAAALYLGLDTLIADMKRLNTWLYIVDPIQKRVFGVTKGKKNKARDTELRDRYIQQLPQTPIRAPSQVIRLSNYKFEEKYAYKPKSYRNFILNPLDSPEHLDDTHDFNHKYLSVLQTLLIVSKQSGLTLYSLHTQTKKFDDQMISGFLSAIDSFAQGFGGTRGTEEITYKGFIVRAISGEKVKSIAILSESSDQSLTDRLRRYTNEFESRYTHEIAQFIEIGENQLSGNSQVEEFTRQMLSL
ncbi:MAG: hypothetical protein ACTSYU_07210 [Promethearchaeota archaeon]